MIHHALVLNYHQPPSNLDRLLEEGSWEAKEILFAMDRMPRALWEYEDVARVHLNLSGTLLETLSSPSFQERVFGIVKLGDLLWHLQNTNIFDILGTAYYHSVFPLIPPADWDAQVTRWKDIAQHLFWRSRFNGFWPPEMGFCMEMIPMLKRNGFQYVMVDDIYIQPEDPNMSWQERRYRPHLCRYGNDEITIIVRDRDLSNAQLSGMDPFWFINELQERTQHCNFEPLVTTASDGDNGGWFRNYTPEANFWHAFYRPFLDNRRCGPVEIKPTFIHEYLEKHPPSDYVTVHKGAWNTEDHYGDDFTQWQGTQEQKDALARIHKVSARYHAQRNRLNREQPANAAARHAQLDEALWRLLRAETSCNLYWGTAWVPKLHEDLDAAETFLG